MGTLPMDPAGPVDDANNASPTGPWTAHRTRRPQAPQAQLQGLPFKWRDEEPASYFLKWLDRDAFEPRYPQFDAPTLCSPDTGRRVFTSRGRVGARRSPSPARAGVRDPSGAAAVGALCRS